MDLATVVKLEYIDYSICSKTCFWHIKEISVDMKYVYAVVIFIAGFLLGLSLPHEADISDENYHPQHKINQPELSNAFNPFAVKTEVPKQAETIATIKLKPLTSTSELTSKRVDFIDKTFSRSDDDYWYKVLNHSNDQEEKLRAISNLVADEQHDNLAIGLGDPSEDIRKETILGLGAINSEEAIRIVGQALLSDPSEANRLVAIDILEQNLFLNFAADFLNLAIQNDPAAEVRQKAMASLGQEAKSK